MGEKVALGQAAPQLSRPVVITKPTTLEERMQALEQRIEDLTRAFFVEAEKRSDVMPDDDSLHGIPVGTCLKGITKGQPYWLTVETEGFFVGVNKFKSLSAAAEHVSGVRRSGWTFWCLPDGRTAKEVYGR